jgi:hypothetical protein
MSAPTAGSLANPDAFSALGQATSPNLPRDCGLPLAAVRGGRLTSRDTFVFLGRPAFVIIQLLAAEGMDDARRAAHRLGSQAAAPWNPTSASYDIPGNIAIRNVWSPVMITKGLFLM